MESRDAYFEDQGGVERSNEEKKIIIYSWENSVRCLFEVKTDNVIP